MKRRNELFQELSSNPQGLLDYILQLQEQKAQLQEQASQLQEQKSKLQERLNHALEQIGELKRQLFGSKSDKLSDEQERKLNELTQDMKDQAQRDQPISKDILEETSAKDEGKKTNTARTPRQSKHPGPVQLKTEQVVLEPEDKLCQHCQKPLTKKIAEEISREYEYIPAQLIERIIVRPKYGGECSCGGVRIAPLPEKLIPQSRLGVGLAVHILLCRFDDHIAYYTLERIFWERFGAKITRQQMVQWVEKIAFLLQGIYNLIWRQMQQSDYLQIDETPVRVRDPDVTGKTVNGYLWFYSIPGNYVFLEFNQHRSQKVVMDRLSEFKGTIQTDGYGAYQLLPEKMPGIKRIGCLAHARRRFYTVLKEELDDGLWFISQIRELYAIERQIGALGEEERLKVRNQQARPIWYKMGKMARKLVREKKYLAKSSMGDALSYFLKSFRSLVGYLRQAQYQIDNNLVENDIRPTAIGRRRWLFIGHPDAGWRSAVIYTLIGSCRRLGINPQEYLTDVLKRLPSMKNHEIGQLLPERWKTSRAKM